MSAIDDGGPAFPRASTITPDGETWTASQAGMSLRDWFAGQVDVTEYKPLQTFMKVHGKEPTALELAEWVSLIRYTEADTMLIARNMLAARKGGAND